jgi:hypothetical protein
MEDDIHARVSGGSGPLAGGVHNDRDVRGSGRGSPDGSKAQEARAREFGESLLDESGALFVLSSVVRRLRKGPKGCDCAEAFWVAGGGMCAEEGLVDLQDASGEVIEASAELVLGAPSKWEPIRNEGKARPEPLNKFEKCIVLVPGPTDAMDVLIVGRDVGTWKGQDGEGRRRCGRVRWAPFRGGEVAMALHGARLAAPAANEGLNDVAIRVAVNNDGRYRGLGD